MRAMQRAVFDIPDPFLNPRVNCDALPGVDLDLWKERVTCKGGRRVERDSVADYPQNWDLMIKRAGMGYFWLCLCTSNKPVSVASTVIPASGRLVYRGRFE